MERRAAATQVHIADFEDGFEMSRGRWAGRLCLGELTRVLLARARPSLRIQQQNQATLAKTLQKTSKITFNIATLYAPELRSFRRNRSHHSMRSPAKAVNVMSAHDTTVGTQEQSRRFSQTRSPFPCQRYLQMSDPQIALLRLKSLNVRVWKSGVADHVPRSCHRRSSAQSSGIGTATSTKLIRFSTLRTCFGRFISRSNAQASKDSFAISKYAVSTGDRDC